MDTSQTMIKQKTVTSRDVTVPLLHLWQTSPQDIVHGDGFYGAFHNTGGGVIHEIGRNAQGFRQQFINATQ